MTDAAISRVASWFDVPPSDERPVEQWACVEIFGHRKHYGRISEIERFGAKMIRVDVPVVAAAPLLGEPERFETHAYGGAAIFSVTLMTEEAARKWATPQRVTPLARLPSPDYDSMDEDPF